MNTLTILTVALLLLAQAAGDEAETKRVLLPYYGREAAKCDFYGARNVEVPWRAG